MEKVIRGFVWGKKEDQNRMSKVSWDKVIRPKEEGGLGLRKLHLVNKAFGMKLCWGLYHNKDALWGKILCSKYKFDPQSGFDPIASNVCTPLWRLVCSTWADMWKNVRWALGTGNKVQFWIHIWVPNLQVKLSEVVLRPISDYLLYKPVSFFVEDSKWAWHKFEHLIPTEIVNLIAATMPPDTTQGEDVAFWGPSSTGSFSLKTAYDNIMGSPWSGEFLPWKGVWHWYGPQRIKTFFWLLLNNGVLINEERVRRHTSASAICAVCGRFKESRMHMIRDCVDARKAWEGILKYGGVEGFFNTSMQFNEWLVHHANSKIRMKNGVRWCTVFGTGCWHIWKRRCGFVLNGERLEPVSVSSLAIIMAKNIEDARLATIVYEKVPREPILVSWKPPPPSILKLNTDASLESDLGQAFGGGVIRDYTGQWRHGFVVNIGVCSILLAEIWCIFHGLELAKKLGLRVLEVESDNFVAVAMILGKFEVSVSCKAIVGRICKLISEFDSAVVRHVHREGNFAADFLSHHAYSFARGVHALDQPPSGLNIWLLHDRIDISYCR